MISSEWNLFMRPMSELYTSRCIMLKYTEILEVNLFAFVYRLFHEVFAQCDGLKCVTDSVLPWL